jgi:hypothetical protein
LNYRGLPFAPMTLLATRSICQATAGDLSPRAGESRWTVVRSDEFNDADGSRPDAAKWKFEVGGNGWGNHELEYHTNRPKNSFILGGNLVIHALKESFTGPEHMTRKYTSARMTPQGLSEQTYGRFEARLIVFTWKGKFDAPPIPPWASAVASVQAGVTKTGRSSRSCLKKGSGSLSIHSQTSGNFRSSRAASYWAR